jgi:putative N6-adenine-specific DNA methylase
MTYRLFLVIPPGFEELSLLELESKCPVSSFSLTKGGIEVDADLEWIVKAHCLLKLPTRILLRMTEFKVRDFPKLYQKLKSFHWNQFLSHPTPSWEVSCTKSRLMHTGRIEETLKSSLLEALKRQPLGLDWQKKNYPPQTFYVRLSDDLLTLSLDLTGTPLYKRGLQKIKGEAPIRENLASALLMELCQGIKDEVILVDPMCGSGTFLTESLFFHKPLHLRKFAFETAPFFKGKMIRLPEEGLKLPIKRALGFDKDGLLLSKVREESGLELYEMDTVSHPLKMKDEFIIMCNPPYGERIKIDGKRGKFLQEAFKKFLYTDLPLRFGWVLPSDMDDLFKTPPHYRLMKKKSFKNGGLSVTFWVWEKMDIYQN